MAVFISYSHRDREFVDKLAVSLVRDRKHVWLDRWELKPGDSLIQRIQEAVGEAGALLVVLSKAAVESEWCRKELAVGLTRELAEKRILVVPVLLEECDVPPFLQDKVYADFRSDFQAGFRSLLEAVSDVSNTRGGRVTSDADTYDWGTEWGFLDEQFLFTVWNVQTSAKLPFSVVTTVSALADSGLTARYVAMDKAGFGEVFRSTILALLVDWAEQSKLSLVLSSAFPETRSGVIAAPPFGRYEVTAMGRRLGGDTGKDVLVHLDLQLKSALDAALAGQARYTAQDWARLQALQASLQNGIGIP